MKILSFTLLLAFATHSYALNEPQKIIGNNDIIAVNADAGNVPAKYRKILDAFGFIDMGCTATHIGNGIVLTAGHCFWAADALMKDGNCENNTIKWGLRDGRSAYMTSKCVSILFAQRNSVNNDFAVIKVDPIPTAAVGVETERKAQPGDQLTVFSYPEDMPLRWSQSCQVMQPTDKQLPPQAMQHNCDTNPGSSGAALLDPATLKIVGIHDGGRLTSPVDGMNYGTFMTNAEVLNSLKALGF